MDQKIWLQSYPQDVPAEIPPSPYISLVQLLEASFAKYASRPAYTCMGQDMSYCKLDQWSQQIAFWLQKRGLKKGARVAIMMPNVLQYPIVMAGVLRAGYTIVNVNPLYTPRELEHQIIDSGAQAIFILENFAHTLEAVFAKTEVKHVVVASMGDLLGTLKGALVNFVVRKVKKMVPEYNLPGAVRFTDLLANTTNAKPLVVDVGPDDIAFLQYTGGTTGVSKGATLAHRNLVANVIQLSTWMKPITHRFEGKDAPQSTIVCALPLYHIFALTLCALLGAHAGGRNLLIPNPRDIPNFVKELSKGPFHWFPAVNTLFNALMNDPNFEKLDFSGLQFCLGGGMAVQKSVAERWMKLTGSCIIEGYGLSETSPVATANRLDAKEYSGAIGLPLPSTEIAILDVNNIPVALGQIGEIAIRGPQVMLGYWNRPDETAKIMTADGFFKSGDMGTMSENGYVKLIDRKKDMVLVSGFNVYPNEVEDILSAMPGVLECACIGVPNEHSGEVVKVFIVRKDPELTIAQVNAYCKEQLTAYKRPKYVEFRDSLPKTNVGKILRRDLRETKEAA